MGEGTVVVNLQHGVTVGAEGDFLTGIGNGHGRAAGEQKECEEGFHLIVSFESVRDNVAAGPSIQAGASGNDGDLITEEPGDEREGSRKAR
jgi:hypothetical protein